MFCKFLVFSGLLSLLKGIAILVVPFGMFAFVFAITFGVFAIAFAFIRGSVATTALSFVVAGSLQFGQAFLLILGLDDVSFHTLQF